MTLKLPRDLYDFYKIINLYKLFDFGQHLVFDVFGRFRDVSEVLGLVSLSGSIRGFVLL